MRVWSLSRNRSARAMTAMRLSPYMLSLLALFSCPITLRSLPVIANRDFFCMLSSSESSRCVRD